MNRPLTRAGGPWNERTRRRPAGRGPRSANICAAGSPMPGCLEGRKDRASRETSRSRAAERGAHHDPHRRIRTGTTSRPRTTMRLSGSRFPVARRRPGPPRTRNGEGRPRTLRPGRTSGAPEGEAHEPRGTYRPPAPRYSGRNAWRPEPLPTRPAVSKRPPPLFVLRMRKVAGVLEGCDRAHVLRTRPEMEILKPA